MAHQITPPLIAAERAAQLDRQADAELAHGRHRQAEELAHRAAEFRRLSVLAPRRALAALAGEVT